MHQVPAVVPLEGDEEMEFIAAAVTARYEGGKTTVRVDVSGEHFGNVSIAEVKPAPGSDRYVLCVAITASFGRACGSEPWSDTLTVDRRIDYVVLTHEQQVLTARQVEKV